MGLKRFAVIPLLGLLAACDPMVSGKTGPAGSEPGSGVPASGNPAVDLLNTETQVYVTACSPEMTKEACAERVKHRARTACRFTADGVFLVSLAASEPVLKPYAGVTYATIEYGPAERWNLHVRVTAKDSVQSCGVVTMAGALQDDRAASQARMERITAALKSLNVSQVQ